MKIEFFIPRNETIPTALRLKIDDRYDVDYKRLPDKFAYAFTFFKSQGVTEDMARLMTEAIIDRMVSQSYDHGQQWRADWIWEWGQDEYTYTVTMGFRIKDSY